jgi:hypothetical protein
VTAFDWQRMWMLASLLGHRRSNDDTVRAALDFVRTAGHHPALQAVAVIFVTRFGSHSRRTALRESYASAGGPYVQSAFLFAARSLDGVERRNAIASWEGHSELHRLVAKAIAH